MRVSFREIAFCRTYWKGKYADAEEILQANIGKPNERVYRKAKRLAAKHVKALENVVLSKGRV